MKLNRYSIYLVSYVLIALGTAMFSQSGEVRPFFNGHWFIKTPFQIIDFGLLIDEVDGEKKIPAVYFDRAGNLLGKNWSFDRYNLGQRIGDAFLSGNDQKFQETVSILKSHLNRKLNVHFILQKRVYDPKEYISAGTVKSAENLKTFEVGFE